MKNAFYIVILLSFILINSDVISKEIEPEPIVFDKTLKILCGIKNADLRDYFLRSYLYLIWSKVDKTQQSEKNNIYKIDNSNSREMLEHSVLAINKMSDNYERKVAVIKWILEKIKLLSINYSMELTNFFPNLFSTIDNLKPNSKDKDIIEQLYAQDIKVILRNVAKKSPIISITICETINNKRIKYEILGAVLQEYAKSNPKNALAYVDKVEEGNKIEIIKDILEEVKDIDLLLASIENISSSHVYLYDKFMDKILEKRKDYIINIAEDKKDDSLLGTIVQHLSETEANLAFELTEKITDKSIKLDALFSISLDTNIANKVIEKIKELLKDWKDEEYATDKLYFFANKVVQYDSRYGLEVLQKAIKVIDTWEKSYYTKKTYLKLALIIGKADVLTSTNLMKTIISDANETIQYEIFVSNMHYEGSNYIYFNNKKTYLHNLEDVLFEIYEVAPKTAMEVINLFKEGLAKEGIVNKILCNMIKNKPIYEMSNIYEFLKLYRISCIGDFISKLLSEYDYEQVLKIIKENFGEINLNNALFILAMNYGLSDVEKSFSIIKLMKEQIDKEYAIIYLLRYQVRLKNMKNFRVIIDNIFRDDASLSDDWKAYRFQRTIELIMDFLEHGYNVMGLNDDRFYIRVDDRIPNSNETQKTFLDNEDIILYCLEKAINSTDIKSSIKELFNGISFLNYKLAIKLANRLKDEKNKCLAYEGIINTIIGKDSKNAISLLLNIKSSEDYLYYKAQIASQLLKSDEKKGRELLEEVLLEIDKLKDEDIDKIEAFRTIFGAILNLDKVWASKIYEYPFKILNNIKEKSKKVHIYNRTCYIIYDIHQSEDKESLFKNQIVIKMINKLLEVRDTIQHDPNKSNYSLDYDLAQLECNTALELISKYFKDKEEKIRVIKSLIYNETYKNITINQLFEDLKTIYKYIKKEFPINYKSILFNCDEKKKIEMNETMLRRDFYMPSSFNGLELIEAIIHSLSSISNSNVSNYKDFLEFSENVFDSYNSN